MKLALDVWIHIHMAHNSNPKLLVDKVQWITDNLGKSWRNIIITPDKSLLKGNFFIDPHASIEEGM
jgi:5'(3')-deoxyribonucleotidase